MVITELPRAQNQKRRRPEIIMVGSAVVITRIIPRTALQPRGQTFRRLPHRPGRRRRAQRSSLRLHLPQHRKRQREEDLFEAAAKRISLPLCFRPGSRKARTAGRFVIGYLLSLPRRSRLGSSMVPRQFALPHWHAFSALSARVIGSSNWS